MKTPNKKHAVKKDSKILGVMKTPVLKTPKKKGSISTPNNNSKGKKQTPESIKAALKSSTWVNKKSPKGKLNGSAAETPTNFVQKKEGNKPATNNNNSVKTNKKNRSRKRKLSENVAEEQIKTKQAKKSIPQKKMAPAESLLKQKPRKPLPKIKDGLPGIEIAFPRGWANYKSSVLNVLNICEDVCLPHPFKFSFTNPEEDVKKISTLKNLTVGGKKLNISLKKSDPLRRSIKIMSPTADKEAIRKDFNAVSIEPSKGVYLVKKNPIYYTLTFDSKATADNADKLAKNKGTKYSIQNFLIAVEESVINDDKATVQQVSISFPVGSSDHKSVLLKILKLWEILHCPNQIIINCKTSEEAKEKSSALLNVKVEGRTGLTVKQKISDPLRRTLLTREDKNDKTTYLKTFGATSIEHINLRGKNNFMHVLTFGSKAAAAAADKKTVTLNNKEFSLRSFNVYLDKKTLVKNLSKNKKEVAARATKKAKIENVKTEEDSDEVENEEQVSDDNEVEEHNDEEEEEDDDDEDEDEEEEDEDEDEDDDDDDDDDE